MEIVCQQQQLQWLLLALAALAPTHCMGVFSDTDPIVIVHVHVCVGGEEEEIMCLGPQQCPGSRGPCYDPTPWKL